MVFYHEVKFLCLGLGKKVYESTSFFLKINTASPVKNIIWPRRIPADLRMDDMWATLPFTVLLSNPTLTSKNPFHPNICEVNRYGFMETNKGSSIVVRIVNTMMTLIVATIGPMAFSAKTDKRKEREATVVMAMAAKPNADISLTEAR